MPPAEETNEAYPNGNPPVTLSGLQIAISEATNEADALRFQIVLQQRLERACFHPRIERHCWAQLALDVVLDIRNNRPSQDACERMRFATWTDPPCHCTPGKEYVYKGGWRVLQGVCL